MITATCTHCQYSTEVHDSLAGKRARCPKCRGVFRIDNGRTPEARATPFPETPRDDGAKAMQALCSECGFTKTVPASFKGRTAKCPNCARVITIQERPRDAKVPTTTFTCPHCGESRIVKAEYSGKKVRCPKCSQPSIINSEQQNQDQVKVVEPLDAPGSTSPDSGSERRRASRMSVSDFDIAMGVIGVFPIRDVDEFGFGFDTADSDWEFKRNQIINFDITTGRDIVLARLQARVTRINYGSVGCVFIDITPDQYTKLTREMQTRKINLQHEHGDNPLKTLLLNLHKSGNMEDLLGSS